MDSEGERLKGGEITMSEKRNVDGNEVIVNIPTEGDAEAVTEGKSLKGSSSKESETAAPKQARVDSPRQASTKSSAGVAKSALMSCPSPEITSFSHTQNEQPEAPNANEALLWTLNRSVYSKPKSRYEKRLYSLDANMFEEEPNPLLRQLSGDPPYGGSSFNQVSPNNRSTRLARNVPVTMVKWIVFFLILWCLVASLMVYKLEASRLWGFEMWKWCVLVMVLFFGMSVTNWVMHFIDFLMKNYSLLPEEVVYFVLGFKKSIQVITWLALVLLTWILLFHRGVKRSNIANKVLHYITWNLVSILIGSCLWFIKTLLLKILALSFHGTTLFGRIRESIFHHYVLQTLSGPPLIEEAKRVGTDPSDRQFSFRTMKKVKIGKEEEKVINMGKIYKMKQEMVSTWTMNVLVDEVKNLGLSTLSNTLDESIDDGGVEQAVKEITNEMEAMAAAYHIFDNVAMCNCRYFDVDDLGRFMIKEEVDLIFPLLDGAETGKIDRKSLTNWVVKAFQGRKVLIDALTSTAERQLNKLVMGILILTTVVIWLLLMEIATTKVLLLLSTQLFMAAFVFGNTCKTIFEAIIFVFVAHPFDVGDRCVIDGVELMVEDVSILNTVFLKLDNEKIYYPNLVLAMKPISNYNRSPDMGEQVEFSIEFETPLERIEEMKDRIKSYLENNPQLWHLKHIVVVSAIENRRKMTMGLYVNHTINFQDFEEKSRRRTELIIELKRIFDDLDIGYYVLPKEVQPLQNENKKQE